MTNRRTLLAAFGVSSFLTPAGAALAAENCASSVDTAAASALLDRYIEAVNAHDTSSFAEIFTETYLQRSGRNPPGLAAHIDSARRLYAVLPDLHLVV